jgi:hypothetical protein
VSSTITSWFTHESNLGIHAAQSRASMSWMITDQNELRGTCYIEVLPGKYQNKCWTPQSVYFEEAHFGFIELTIIRHCPKYDHYAFTDINKAIWQNILADLDRLQQRIGKSTRLSDIRDEVFITMTESRFVESEAENMRELRQTLNNFVRWARGILDSHDSIAVLGI